MGIPRLFLEPWVAFGGKKPDAVHKAEMLRGLREEVRQTAERVLARPLTPSEVNCLEGIRSVALLRSCRDAWGSEGATAEWVASALQDLPVIVPPRDAGPWNPQEGGLRVMVSVMLGLATVAVGLMAAFFMFMAGLNLDPSQLSHLAILVTGWSAVPVCLFCGLRMICRPSLRAMRGGRWALVMIVLLWVSVWIQGGKGLMH